MNFSARSKVALLAMLLLAAFGCGLHGHGGGGTGDKADANPLDTMTRSINAQLNAKSYRAHMESSVAGRNFTSTIEYVAPDRYHMVSTGNETIVVGPSTYMKIGNNPWQKSPVDAGKMISAFRDSKMIEEIRKSTEVKYVGTDTLDGMPVRVYTYTLTNPAGMEGTTVTKAWVSSADDLPRKMEVEADIKGNKTKSTITYSDYNTAIKIEPPM